MFLSSAKKKKKKGRRERHGERDFTFECIQKINTRSGSLLIHAARECGRKSRKRRSRLVTVGRRKSNVGWRPIKERELLLLTDRLVGGRRLDETSGRRTQVVSLHFFGHRHWIRDNQSRYLLNTIKDLK